MANYLYNGQEFKDINTVWKDKKTYPHAAISVHYFPLPLAYTLYLSADEFKCGVTGDLGDFSGVSYNYDSAKNEWVYDKEFSYPYGSNTGSVIWANINVYYADSVTDTGGTVFLAASYPIPVGGEPTDPTTQLKGWLAGRAVASQRGKQV